MIGLVLVTHGALADNLLKVVEHIMGKQERFEVVGVDPESDLALSRERIIEAMEAVDTGRGVIVATDLFGGIPCNLAISLMQGKSVEVLAGLNLPMLIKLISVREALPLSRAVHHACEAGRRYLDTARHLLDLDTF